MKGRVVALGTVDGRAAAAHMVDGVLDDLIVAPAGDGPAVCAIYRARLGRPLKGQGGAILQTPDGPVFLRNAKGIGGGQSLLVQVVSFPERGKAPPVTPRVLIKSRYVIATPGAPGINISREIRDDEMRVALQEALADVGLPEDAGLIIRSAAVDGPEAVLADLDYVLPALDAILGDDSRDPELLFEAPSPATQGWRDWPTPDLVEDGPTAFDDHGVSDALDALRRVDVALAGGASMAVEATRALVAVDVNTGGDTSPAAGLKANIAALRDLPRQLRLRGLGGQIVMDLAPYPKKDRRQIEQVARAALKADPIETSLVGWTPLGHLELQRKRERAPLWDDR